LFYSLWPPIPNDNFSLVRGYIKNWCPLFRDLFYSQFNHKKVSPRTLRHNIRRKHVSFLSHNAQRVFELKEKTDCDNSFFYQVKCLVGWREIFRCSKRFFVSMWVGINMSMFVRLKSSLLVNVTDLSRKTHWKLFSIHFCSSIMEKILQQSFTKHKMAIIYHWWRKEALWKFKF
jgi:hypothetical protein